MKNLVTIGPRQKSLLESLLHSHVGMTVDELATVLGISRNAVTQHLSSLLAQGFVDSTIQASKGGRPSKCYRLTLLGRELFPRHYALFTNLLIQLLDKKLGAQVLSQYMTEIGETIAGQYSARISSTESLTGRIDQLAALMQELGYEARVEGDQDGEPEIVACNCVFHKLAVDSAAVCDLDIALIATALKGVVVEHRECMVRGGACCRFGIASK